MTYQDVEKQLRECKKCGEIKYFDEFTVNRGCKHNIEWTCKDCTKKNKEEYNQVNKNHIKQNKHRYYMENKEKFDNYRLKYISENKEKLSDYYKLYNLKNKEKRKEYAKKYYIENRSSIIVESRKSYKYSEKEKERKELSLINLKKCSMCGDIKEFSYFHKSNKAKSGRASRCKECTKKTYKYNYVNKPRELTHLQRENLELEKSGLKKCSKCGEIKKVSMFYLKITGLSPYESRCKKCVFEISKKNSDKNKDKKKKYDKLYVKKNLNKIKKRQNNKYNNDLQYKMQCVLRNRLNKHLKLKSTEKRNKTLDYLGCSINNFCKHIESKFDKHMNWENHGNYCHLDHIFPLSKADMAKESEIKKVMHWSNFQPLEAKENISKGAKLNWSAIK